MSSFIANVERHKGKWVNKYYVLFHFWTLLKDWPQIDLAFTHRHGSLLTCEMVVIKVRSVPDLFLMTILKGVLTIRCFNDVSVWNLRQMKTQKIKAENNEARSLILQWYIMTGKISLGVSSVLSPWIDGPDSSAFFFFSVWKLKQS